MDDTMVKRFKVRRTICRVYSFCNSCFDVASVAISKNLALIHKENSFVLDFDKQRKAIPL